MATEQDWASYADQGYLLTTDTLLARTSLGAGVEVPGGALMALRSDGKTAEIKKAVPGADIKVRAWNASTGACGAYYETTTDTANSFALFGIWDNAGAPYRSLACGSAVATAYDACDTHIWTAYSGSVKLLSNTANFRPGTDNGMALGWSSFRWSLVYAATGTINTSDEREKEWRGAASEAELRAAKRIAAELGFYRWLDAVAEKGEEARYHFGVRAQKVWRIMAEEGLIDPIGEDGRPGATPYAFLCFDEWQDEAEVCGEDGKVMQPEVKAGNRYGLRVDQLTLFLIAAQERRLAALEAIPGNGPQGA